MSSNPRDVERQNAQADKERADQARPLVPAPEPNRVGVSKGETEKPNEYEYRCDHPTKDEADTCSQWRSANAAEEQVKASWWGFGASLVSAIATAVAAVAAGMAATSAAASNRIARDTAESELRAYVFAAQAKIEFTKNTAKVTVAIFNYGQTPAYKFDQTTRIDVNVLPFEPDYIVEGQRDKKRMDCIPPRGNAGVIVESKPLVGNRMALAKAGATPTFVSGTIWYDDAFGEERYTKFRFVYRGIETDPPGIMMAAEGGNEAT